MGKEISELANFQHQSGGFYDNVREANVRDTMRGVWIASVYGAYYTFDVQRTFRWVQTLHNRDGGAGYTPGSKSSIFATYCYMHIAQIISPQLFDGPRTLEFLKTCYDTSSGLFKDSTDSFPSIEATYYAYQILTKFQDADLTWISPYNIQTYINDHLNDDHFDFEGISDMKAQLFAASIAKYVGVTVPYHRISEYIVNKINHQIKEDKLDNEEAATAALILKLLGEEAIPDQLITAFKSENTLADIYNINQILVATGEISKFFEIKVHLFTADNRLIDFEKDGITFQQIIRPTIEITGLGRFINFAYNVNITTTIGDEAPYSESLRPDRQSGQYISQRISSATKLGQMQIDVVAWYQNELGSPVILTKSATARVSLPVDVTCEASLSSDEIIPEGGEIVPGVKFNVHVSGKFDDIELQESTAATFQVTDPSGTVLYHSFEEFKDSLDFSFTLQTFLPAGSLRVIVEVGDKVNGIHTQKVFSYKVANTMTAVNIDVPENLKLSDILHVKMSPALLIGEENRNEKFTNEKLSESDLKDATGEPFYPQSSSESHHYTMNVKVGSTVVKSVEGEVSVDENNNLIVDFETSVNENLDFATGFSLSFLFIGEGAEPIELQHDPLFVKVSSKVVAEGEELPKGKLEYGSKISTEFRLKDQDTNKYLEAGYAYPIIAILRASDRQILIEKKAKSDDDKYSVKISVSAAVESGNAIVALMIRRGDEVVPVLGSNGKNFESSVTISGEIEFNAHVVEARKHVIVDFTTTHNGKKLRGTAFVCRITDSTGNIVGEFPLVQMKSGSRLSWESGDAKGVYNLQIRRSSSRKSAPLFEKTITVENQLVSFIHHLPIEGLTLIGLFSLFVWSIIIRKNIQSTR